jgi:hypothetical protein
MTKKNLVLIFFALALVVVYMIWFTDWFRPATVRIFDTNRSLRPNLRRNLKGAALPNLMFGVNRTLRLTEVKVVAVNALETNKNSVPLWHLVSDSNSVPVKQFFYGQGIGGMRPAIKGVRPEPLETNVTYRLFLAAGKVRGEHDFELQ